MSEELGTARALLHQAELDTEVATRFRSALLGARHGAVALLATRRPRRSGLPDAADDLWPLLARVAPGYAEWASWFGFAEGIRRVSERQADDLVRDLRIFLDQVTLELTMARRQPVTPQADHG